MLEGLRDYVLDGEGLVPSSLHVLTPPATTSGSVTAYFKNLEQELIVKIRQYPIVVGCVAWLTNAQICGALASRRHASFVVQKEDFLRPDVDDYGIEVRRGKYQALYGRIGRTNFDRYHFPEPLRSASYCSDPSLDGVRCVGVRADRGSRSAPRAHHKFAVFCREGVSSGESHVIPPTPCAVWTGSYNWTFNAERSFENAVFIEDHEIADAYFREWALLTSVSERLDWETEYMEPEWRIGS